MEVSYIAVTVTGTFSFIICKGFCLGMKSVGEPKQVVVVHMYSARQIN
jgi:hypothetical protein